jgi:alkylhydroperoxidase/carboxymuconolactone decarboxylase family protein YurZ
MALGVATSSDGCLGFQTQALMKLGSTKQEVIKSLVVAINKIRRSSLIYALTAVKQTKA